MSVRAATWLFATYLVALVVLAVAVHVGARLAPATGGDAIAVVSEWQNGQRHRKEVLRGDVGAPPAHATHTVVVERAAEVGRLSGAPLLFAMAVVPGRDGVRADLDGKTAVVTPDDLLRAGAYDHAFSVLDPSFVIGTSRDLVLLALGAQLGTDADDVARRATLTRVRFTRTVTHPARGTEAPPLDGAEGIRDDIHAAGRHLARMVGPDGRFRYLVDATTDATLPGYSLPRHAGATFFLAQAADVVDDGTVRWGALRAAAWLRDAMVACGPNRCVADGPVADVGSSALALVAFTEIERSGADHSYRPAIRELAAFLRAQQRPDGELMHEYDRAHGAPRDVQRLYFTGEAALALARASRITGDARDVEAASRALAHTVRRAWRFFGDRYFVNEEHWTCQAMAELWDRAPDPEALAFCLRWHAYQGHVQYDEGETPFDAGGSYGVGPFVTPRLTSAASRAEALGATLSVLRDERLAGRPSAEEHPLRQQLERAVSFIRRRQLRPGRAPVHVYAASASGAFPGSSVDPILRIDYSQHAGSALVRVLTLPRATGD